MPPALVALTGPLRGRRFVLDADGSTVGRHRDSDVPIADLSVSRRHCRIWRDAEADAWRLRDLDSRDGTFVNGRPVRETTLAPGDLVLVASSTFVFEAASDDDAPSSEPARSRPRVELDGAELDDDTVLRRAVTEASILPAGVRTARSLGVLLDLAAALGGRHSVEVVIDRLLDGALRALPMDRALVLGLDEALDLVTVVRHASARSTDEAETVRLSRTVVDAVRDRGTAIAWTGDAGPVGDAESLSGSGIRALVAVPILVRSRPAVLLYLDTRRPIGDDEDDGEAILQLATAIAAIAAGALDAALHAESLERENRRLRDSTLGEGMIGESHAMARAWAVLDRAAASDATILLLGESGTGKEMAARAVHAASPRRDRPFVAINCATLGENLLESELFGHERGAFTGAVARKEGKLKVAEGGTLFLDEVGELPLPLQAKLLRLLQERTFERVGGTRPITVDLRWIAATNRDLERAVAEGDFRDDLFYRLNVIAVTLPPLRERRDDIALLASHFAAHHGRAVRGRPLGVGADTRAILAAYDWPGNVRELSNVIERAAVLGTDDAIRPGDLPENLLERRQPTDGGEAMPFHDAVNALKQRLIVDAVRESGGNITRAAERLGLHANHLHRLITNFELRDTLRDE